MITETVARIVLVFASTIALANSIPVSWKARTNPEDMNPVTSIEWSGKAANAGAFLLSRINLSFLNHTCQKYASDLDVAIQVVQVLIDSKFVGSTSEQVNQYGYVLLKLESDVKEVIDYLTSLLLCLWRHHLWVKYETFKKLVTLAWKGLKTTGLKINQRQNNNPQIGGLRNKESLGNSSRNLGNGSEPVSADSSVSILDLLEAARPSKISHVIQGSHRQRRSPIVIGLGLGFLGSYLLGQYFGDNNDQDIEILNRNIQKQNQNIKVTNERIDILAKNVSQSVSAIKNILDKLVETQSAATLHYAILWNLEQLASSTIETMSAFKAGELTLTLLTQGILDAELIDLTSFKKIISEGLKSFPELEFPLEITRYDLVHLVKIIKVQRVDHLKFMMVIPLTRKQKYRVFSLIPHPVRIGPTNLVLPEFKDILLVDDYTYIITNKKNIYSMSLENHLVLDVEPIYNQKKSTCEWEGYKNNGTAMLKLCNYKKVGHLNDTFVIETDQHRLVYFSEQTKVSLDCPDKQVRDTLIGLHKLPLACNIETDSVFWPAKQTVTISLELNDTDSFVADSTYLPIIDVNKSSNVHSSLRELINTLPKEDDEFTIDFDYYNLTLEKIQTYSIYAQSIVATIVVINSLLIGFLFIKWIYNKRQNRIFSRHSSMKNRFRGLRDSIRSKTSVADHRRRLRKARESIRSRSRNMRDSLRSRGSSLKRKIKERDFPSPRPNKKLTQDEPSPSTNVNAETNTDLNWQLPPYSTDVYPPLPRYT